jgi:tetratricopeptide (TPR) repeat protein
MDYQTYCDKIYEGAGLVEKEEYEAALEKFQEIVNSDVTDLDKALMCNNIAVTCSKMGYLDQALAWFDEGIRYEEPWFRATLRTMACMPRPARSMNTSSRCPM